MVELGFNKSSSKLALMHFALDSLYRSKTYKLLAPISSGVGAIFTLHHVVPAKKYNQFSPNRILEITPEFLEQTIKQVRALNYDIVSLDEVRRRLLEKDFKRKFVCFTLDDGYADNYQNAFPVFKKHNVPFTIYVATGLPDGTALLWWRCLENLIDQENSLTLELAGETITLATATVAEKYKSYEHIYWILRKLPLKEQYSTAQHIFDQYKIDSSAICYQSALSWEKLTEISHSKLATIAAHTVNHFALSKLSPDQVMEEARLSREIIAKKIGTTPKHFSYPYGDNNSASKREFEIIKNLNFDTATTTRKGVLFPEHAQHLEALPRISLNGDYQKQRYINVFLSGSPFALLRRFRHLDIN